MPFKDLVGQATAVAVLQNAIRRKRISHAYLFAGPEQVGKRTAALLFAKGLNCLASDAHQKADGCDQCRPCRLIESGSYPAVRIIQPLGEGEEAQLISIHQVRPPKDSKQKAKFPLSLQKQAYLKADPGEWKVFILDPADRMSIPASNALLQILEEPPPQVVIVLISARPAALLPTIISRCQQVPFRLIGTSAIEQTLIEGGWAEEAQARWLAAQASGRVGWAIRAAQDAGATQARQRVVDILQEMSDLPPSASLKVADDLRTLALEAWEAEMEAAQGQEPEKSEPDKPARISRDRVLRMQLPQILDLMLAWYRDLLVAQQSDPSLIINQGKEDLLSSQAANRTSEQLQEAIQVVLATKDYLQQNANIELALQAMALRLLQKPAERSR